MLRVLLCLGERLHGKSTLGAPASWSAEAHCPQAGVVLDSFFP